MFLDLRGFSPDDEPQTPAAALRRLLAALGDGDGLPEDEDELALRYRRRTEGRRLLVVLDNARSPAQVRPLLPAPGPTAVVTSRRRLDGLVAAEAARTMELRPLAPDDAVARLARRGTTVPAARLGEIARACGYLPLALAVLSAQLSARPDGQPDRVAGR